MKMSRSRLLLQRSRQLLSRARSSPGPSSTLMQDQAKSSQTPRPSAAKGRAYVSVDPIAVRHSPRTVRKVIGL
ncbi:unnamed protein product [Eruca vesicaria subsp. sativa]|uniref:Uncharacterized protein n=1 Tax=Eruca vesicaria subsp. sativa TaxID=29727 RepID=A0ABC8KQ83_ERUVS|nr:unnamed protein product [Eruca vesicaria subsp. sativa]